MRRRRASGVSLYELMVAMALWAVLAAIAGSALRAAHRDAALADGYAQDIARLREASDLLGREIRSSVDVSVLDGRLVLDGETWEARDGCLLRGGDVVVRGVGEVLAERDVAGLVSLSVRPLPRTAGAHVPAVVTQARPRVGGTR